MNKYGSIKSKSFLSFLIRAYSLTARPISGWFSFYFCVCFLQGSSYQIPPVFHGPRDMELNMSLCMPDHITQDVNTALNYIEEVENFKFGTPV